MHRTVKHILFAIAAALPGTAAAQDASTANTDTRYGPTEIQSITKLGRGTVTDSLRITGATAELVGGSSAGYSFNAVPGAKRITRRALAEMTEIPKTGLFIVDADYVPATIMRELRRDGYRLRENGELVDRKGEPITMFVRPETYRLIPETLAPRPDPFERPAPPSKTDDRDPTGGKQGSLIPAPGIPAPTLWARLTNLAKREGFSPISKAHAASPFAWTCFSWSWQWKYRGGFCRDYRAWTNAYAWGPGAGGGCGGALPHTNIQYTRAYARAAGDTDDEYCYICDQEHAFADYDIGCFWPAHGTGSGYHFIHMVDGTLSVVRSSSWAH